MPAKSITSLCLQSEFIWSKGAYLEVSKYFIMNLIHVEVDSAELSQNFFKLGFTQYKAIDL